MNIQAITRASIGARRKITMEDMAILLRNYAAAGLDLGNDCVMPGKDTPEDWAQSCRGILCISVLADGATPHGQVRYDDPGSMHPMHQAEIIFAPAGWLGWVGDPTEHLTAAGHHIQTGHSHDLALVHNHRCRPPVHGPGGTARRAGG